MTVNDSRGNELNKGDRVKYVGSGIKTMVSDPRPDVNTGDKGRVEGDYSRIMVYVKFDKGGEKIEIDGRSLKKI